LTSLVYFLTVVAETSRSLAISAMERPFG
jgi:hypothetical protein